MPVGRALALLLSCSAITLGFALWCQPLASWFSHLRLFLWSTREAILYQVRRRSRGLQGLQVAALVYTAFSLCCFTFYRGLFLTV